MLIFTGYQVEAHFVPVVSGLEPLWLNKQIRSNLVRHQAWTNGHCIHTLATLYTIRLTLFTILSILALYSPWPAAASARPVKNQNRRIWTKKLWRLLFFETHSIYRRRQAVLTLTCASQYLTYWVDVLWERMSRNASFPIPFRFACIKYGILKKKKNKQEWTHLNGFNFWIGW